MKSIYLSFILVFLICNYLIGQEKKTVTEEKIEFLFADVVQDMSVKGDFKTAIIKLDTIHQLAEEIGDDFNWAYSNIFTAYCYLIQNKLDSIAHYINPIENRMHELKMETNLKLRINADYRFLMGVYYYSEGLYEQSLDYYQGAINILFDYAGKDEKGSIQYAKVSEIYTMNLTDLLNDAAIMYYEFGDYDKAISYFEMTLELMDLKKRKTDKKWKNAAKQNNLSAAYIKRGFLEKGIKGLREAKSNLKGVETDYDIETLGLVHKNMADYYYLNNQIDSCHININKALVLNSNDEVKIKSYHIYLNSLKDGEVDEINEVFDSLKIISERSIGYFHPEMAKSYSIKAGIYSHKGVYDKADENYNTAINILLGKKSNHCDCKEIKINELNDKRQAMEIIQKKSKSLSLANKNKEAISCFELLSSLIQELQQKYIVNEESKYFLSKQAKKIYETAIKTSIDLGDLEKAYQFSQSSRSMVLLQQVQEKNAIQATGIPTEILKEGEQLKIEINNLLKKRGEAIQVENDIQIKKYNEIIFSKNKSYENWERRLENTYPDYFALKLELPQIPIKKIQSYVKKQNSNLIEFFVGDDDIYVFVLDGNDIQVSSRKINNEIIRKIEWMIKNISEYNYDFETFNKYVDVSFYLYEKLLGESIEQEWVGQENIIIVPDEILNLLPFEALTTSKYKVISGEIKFNKLDYVLNEFNISYLYSSNLIVENKNNKSNDKFIGIAPSFENPSINKLKDNQSEVQDINDIYGGKILLGYEAVYENVIHGISKSNIAHFATHAVFNDNNPLDSRIELADTSLYIYEILSLPHELQLVVLSACQTAIGERREGEGVISLSRAFIQSGCSSVVASMWDVSDQKASDLLKYFHENLNKKNTLKSKALADAKRKYLSEVFSMNTHPFFWAGYIQIGDNSPVSSSGYSRLWFLFVFLILFIFLFIKMKNK